MSEERCSDTEFLKRLAFKIAIDTESLDNQIDGAVASLMIHAKNGTDVMEEEDSQQIIRSVCYLRRLICKRALTIAGIIDVNIKDYLPKKEDK